MSNQPRVSAGTSSRLAAFYLGFLPAPGAGGSASVGADEITNNHWGVFRIDHQLTTKPVVNFTFNLFDTTQGSPFAFGGASVPGFGATDKRRAYNYVARHTYAFDSDLVNSFGMRLSF